MASFRGTKDILVQFVSAGNLNLEMNYSSSEKFLRVHEERLFGDMVGLGWAAKDKDSRRGHIFSSLTQLLERALQYSPITLPSKDPTKSQASIRRRLSKIAQKHLEEICLGSDLCMMPTMQTQHAIKDALSVQ